MFRVYSLITFAFGRRRRLVRRIGALCLIVMGVHLCADHLDDVIYSILDAVDLVADDTVGALLSWLGEAGGMTPQAALRATDAFASFIDLPEKDWLALWLALFVELFLDVMLFDLAWGRHIDDGAVGMLDELRASARQMIAALSPLDLERLAVLPTLFLYTLGGAALAALAVEAAARDLLSRFAPEFLWGAHSAAALGILTAAVLVWRFAPDMLHGALLRSQQRHERARDKTLRRLEKELRSVRLQRAIARIRLGTRGLWLVLLALPIAVTGLLGHNLIAILERAVPAP